MVGRSSPFYLQMNNRCEFIVGKSPQQISFCLDNQCSLRDMGMDTHTHTQRVFCLCCKAQNTTIESWAKLAVQRSVCHQNIAIFGPIFCKQCSIFLFFSCFSKEQTNKQACACFLLLGICLFAFSIGTRLPTYLCHFIFFGFFPSLFLACFSSSLSYFWAVTRLYTYMKVKQNLMRRSLGGCQVPIEVRRT